MMKKAIIMEFVTEKSGEPRNYSASSVSIRRTGKLFDERCVDSAKTLLHKCPDICAIGFLVFRLYGVFQTDFFGPADDGPSASAPAAPAAPIAPAPPAALAPAAPAAASAPAAPAAAPPARSWRRRKTGYKNTAPKMITAPR